MPWFKGLWFDHVLFEESHVEAFNSAMRGEPLPEASGSPSMGLEKNSPDIPVEESNPSEPMDLGPPSAPEAPSDGPDAPVEGSDPSAPPSEDPEPPPALDAAGLEAAHDKQSLVAMAKNLGIDTKGMNKSQIAQAIIDATSTSSEG
jgi:hypothetical protein